MKAAKYELKKSLDTEEMTMNEDVWGEMQVVYHTNKKQVDVTPLLKGLPNNRDPCPHWGVVTKGQIRILYDEKEEIVKAGEAYYMPPGHTVIAEAGSESWEFSPKDKIKQTLEVIARNTEILKQKTK